jgi:hypothetical protein
MIDGFLTYSRRNFPCVYADVDESARVQCCEALAMNFFWVKNYGTPEQIEKTQKLMAKFKCDVLELDRQCSSTLAE